MYNVSVITWLLTAVWFFGLLFGDLYLNRGSKEPISLKRAVKRSVVWVSLGVLFGVYVWLSLGHKAGTEYFSGFLIEKSLSIDNIFVWSALLAYMKIPRGLQYTVLFWGVLGAIVFRSIFMLAGVAILDSFQFMLVFLGMLLFYTAYTIFRDSNKEFDAKNSRILKFVSKQLPFTSEISGNKLFIKKNGKRIATYLFFAVVVIELTDILFAIDSVPTVIAVVRDPYVAITSNIAAILGLRSLYFVFDGLKQKFWLLKRGLGIILAGVGVTLILEPEKVFGISWAGVKVPTGPVLIAVASILTLSVVGSLVIKPHKNRVRTPN